MITIDLGKQQVLDADPKAIQQIIFTGNLDLVEGATIFFIIEEAKKKKKKRFIFLLMKCESIVNVLHKFILF